MLSKKVLIQNTNKIFTSTILKHSSQEHKLQLTGNKKIDNLLDQGKFKLFELMSIYEEAIGLKEIKQAQDNVLQVFNKI